MCYTFHCMAVHHGNAAVVHEHRKCSDTHVHGKESVDIMDFHVFNTTGIAQVPCIVSCACCTNSTNVRLVISSPVAPAPFLPHDPSELLLSCTASKRTRQMPKMAKLFAHQRLRQAAIAIYSAFLSGRLM